MLKIISLILLSSVKFSIALFAAIAENSFSYKEIIIYTTIGGIIGIIVFTYLTEPIVKSWSWFMKITRTEKFFNKLNRFFFHKKEKIIFSKKNKIIIKAKNNYGLIGIAFLTPIFLSIPVGTFLATRFFPNKKETISYLIISVVIWSNILTSLSVILKEYI